jgi:hypothetical protein
VGCAPEEEAEESAPGGAYEINIDPNAAPAEAPAETTEPAPAESPKPAPAEPEASAATAGAMAAVAGRVVFDGPAPERKPIDTKMDPKCAVLHAGEPLLTEQAVISADGGVANAFVYLKNPPAGDYPVPAEPAVLDQVGCAYVPRVLGVRAGQTVNVKNSDETTHNIRSFPTINKPFNISQPGPGVRERKFDEPEMHVKMKCDFHPWMTSHVFSMAHPFFAVTDADGKFSIANVPAGEYTVGVWHETFGEQEAVVTVGDSGAMVDFTFKAE